MSARKLYADVRYRRNGQRQIVDISHSQKALRRRGAQRIFAVALAVGNYEIIGKELR